MTGNRRYYSWKKTISHINKCHSCGRETGLFIISEWFGGLIKRINCIECYNNKVARLKEK